MKHHLLLSFLFLFLALAAHTQVKVEAKPTGRHAKAINTAKTVKKEAQERKEQIKKIKERKKALKKYEEKYEKLKKKRIKKFEKDSVNLPVWTKEDSIAVAEEILYETNFPVEYREIVLKPVPIDSMAKVTIDSSAAIGESMLENRVKEYMPDELAQPGENPLEGLPTNPMEGGLEKPELGAIKKPSRPNPNLVKPDAAKDLFKKIDPDQFQKVQNDITKLKKKYSSLPDSRFPKEGRKRNSLEDLPFKKRLYFGGMISAQSTDPLILSVNLQVGYQINKKWLAGVGLNIREKFKQDSTALTGDAHGYSLFTRYDILKQFFAWGEMQRQVNRSLIDREATTTPSRWQEAYLLGIGRDFKIGPVHMNSIIMYDFNYQNNDLHNRPIVFRVGVQFGKKK